MDDSCDAVGRVGQVFAEEPPARSSPEAGPHLQVVVGPPRLLAGAARQRGVDRTTRRREAPLRAADEPAPLVGLVELERFDRAAEVSLPALQVVVEESRHAGERMHHQPGADESARVGEPVGMDVRRRQQQQPRGADRVGGHDDDARGLEVLPAVVVDPHRSGRETASVGLDAHDPGASDEAGAVGERLRPVGQVGRRLRSLVATLHARAALHTLVAAVVGRRQDRVGLRPPVPAESIVGPGDLQRARADRERRQRRVLAGRIRRVAAEPRHADVPVVALVVGPQLVVRERPVVGDAVE